MRSTEQFPIRARDRLLDQAKKILSQRQSRVLFIDPDLLGEPGWDILLCAFIAHRKGLVCKVSDVAAEIGISLSATKRWVDILALRDMLVQRDDFFVIGEEMERKLSTMFKLQIKEMAASFNLLAEARGPDT